MRRRDFIRVITGTVVAWPFAARAQQRGKVARIGFLGATSLSGFRRQVEGFRLGLRDLGYIESANIVIEYRWAEGKYERLPELAADLVRSDVDVIVTHGAPGSLAAKRATATVPIVMAVTGDPVAMGLVASVARPGGNITGQSIFSPELGAKRIELLKEVMPRMTRAAFLANPDNPMSVGRILQTMRWTARSLGVLLQQFPVRGPNEFESAFERMEQGRIEGVTIEDDAMLTANIGAIAELAAKRRFLSIGNRDFAQVGGLIGFGVDYFATFRRAAAFVDKILKGTNPADIPIEQATKFEVVVNLKTAKAIGIEMPTATLLRANEVIE
jgi:putative tryptophan/tyrosine transport system substrate-binding protein